MDINKLFEDLSNKQIAKVIAELKANKTLGPKLKDFEIISDAYSILKNPKTRKEKIRTLKKYNDKIKSFIDYFDNALENPVEIIKRKKEGIENIPKEIDTLKKIEGDEKISLLRGYIAQINTYNQMLKKVYESNNNDDLNKIISNTYDGKEVFKKEDNKDDQILSIVNNIIKLLEKIMFENSFSALKFKDDKNQYFKKIKDNLSQAYLAADNIRKKGKDLSYDLKLSKINRDKRKEELENAIKNLDTQINNVDSLINNPGLIAQKINNRQLKIEKFKEEDKYNPQIKRLEDEIKELKSAQRDGGKNFKRELIYKRDAYKNALKKIEGKKPEWQAHIDFEDAISKDISNYFYNINNFKKIISKNDGEIVNEIKKKEELVDQLTREVKELEKYPRLSNISFEDKEEFEKLMNLKKKLIDKIGESKKLIGTKKLKEFEDENKRIQNEIRSYISIKNELIANKAKEKNVDISKLSDKEINDIIKQVKKEKFPKDFDVKNFDENFFNKYYWKIYYTDRNVFNYLRNIFSNKEIETKNKKIKDEILKSEKYQDIKNYLGKGDANNYLELMLTLDGYFKDNRTYSLHNAESLYKAAKELKDADLIDQAQKAITLEKSAEEEKKGNIDDVKELDKSYSERAKQAYKETPKDDDVEFSTRDKEGKIKKQPKYTSKIYNTWTEEDEKKYQEMLKKPIQKPMSSEQALYNRVKRYQKDLPSLFKRVEFILNPEKNKDNKEEFNKEKEELIEKLKSLNKDIKDFDEKNDIIYKDFEELPNIEDIKDISDKDLKKIQSDFNKIFRFSKKYISHLAEPGQPSLKGNNKEVKENSDKRDTNKEIKIKRGLINLIKRIYKENNKTYKDLIKETQKYVEPYQPKTIGLHKVGNIKERQKFNFSEILNIFKYIEDTIADKKNYPEKVIKNKETEENNKKYNEIEKARTLLSDKINDINKKLEIYKDVEKYIKMNSKNKINEDTFVDKAMNRFLEDLKG